jgi:hypothetical protein
MLGKPRNTRAGSSVFGNGFRKQLWEKI